MAKSVSEWIRELLMFVSYGTVEKTYASGESGPLPYLLDGDGSEIGYDVRYRGRKAFTVSCARACTVRFQGKVGAADLFGTLQSKEADGDIVFTLVAGESALIWTDVPCKYLRLFIANTSGAANLIKVTPGFGR